MSLISDLYRSYSCKIWTKQITYHINILMFAVKVLQLPQTSLERVLGYIFCPNQRSVMFLPTSLVIGRHKNNW